MDRARKKPASDLCCGSGQSNTTVPPANTDGQKNCHPETVKNSANGRPQLTPMNDRYPSNGGSHSRSKLPRPNQGVGIFPACKDNTLPMPRRSFSADPLLPAGGTRRHHHLPRAPPIDKPLPPRPALDYMNTSSPSKRGRLIIDASERPLRISRGASEQDWPAITPRSVSDPTENCLTAPQQDMTDPMSRSKTVLANSHASRIDNAVYSSHRPSNVHRVISGTATTASHPQSPASSNATSFETDVTAPRNWRDASSPLARKSSAPDAIHHNGVQPASYGFSPVSPSTCAGGPVFGNRQLLSTDALRILDQGSKLSLTSKAASSVSDPSSLSSSVKRLYADDTQLGRLDEPTFSTGPTDNKSSHTNSGVHPHDIRQGTQNGVEKPTTPFAGTGRQDSLSLMFDEVDLALTKMPPPSNSPYTEPLETIPSQATFPAPYARSVSCDSLRDASRYDMTKLPRLSLRFSRVSSLEEDITSKGASEATFNNAATDASLNDDLAPRAQQLPNRTLSFPGGHDSPTYEQAEFVTVDRIIGRVNPQSDKSHQSQGLSHSIGINEVSARGAKNPGDGQWSPGFAANDASSGNLNKGTSNDMGSQDSMQQLASKWSSSDTPSPQHMSPQPDTSSRKTNNRSIPTRNGQALSSMKPLPKKPSVSESHTSANSALRQNGQSASFVNTGRRRFPPRDSSLHPPKSNPGSVKAAREKATGQKYDGTRSASSAKPASVAPTQKTPHDGIEKASAPSLTQVKDRSKNGTKPASSHARTEKPNYGYNAEVSAPTSVQHSKSRTVLNKINGLFSTKRDKKTNASDTAVQSQMNEPKIDSDKAGINPDVDTGLSTDDIESPPTNLPSPLVRSLAATREPSGDSETSSLTVRRRGLRGGGTERELLALTEQMIDKAQQEETSALRKNSLLTFAKIFSDTIIQAREAQISYEGAQAAATRAEISYEMVQKSVAMLHRLGSSVLNGPDRT